MMTDLLSSLSHLRPRDIIDILVIAFLIYQALRLVKGTRGWQMTLGIISLILFYYLLTQFFELRTVEWLFAKFFPFFIIALIVIFQSEIRRGLAQIGKGGFFPRFVGKGNQERFDEIVLAVTTLSTQKIGGLIVVEREIGLKNYIESGIKLDAFLTYDLLLTIFSPKSPLHDGAVMVQGDRVVAAACFLPLTLDPYLSKELGTRHRAAIGITEETDAIAIVVSEETGNISAIFGGEITRNLDGPRLLRFLQRTIEIPAKESTTRTERRKEREERQEAV
ncbi:diadenylate cyclase CdaA [Acidobacteria bacterium AH-259-G07]|nr:diadenylate cyclase CdaA [Acidobacteria bacterium AH-259-G07]